MTDNTFLCDIDCLLDTRLAVLYRLNKKTIPDILANKYTIRASDSFIGYSIEEFASEYAKRNINDLKQGIITPIIDIIRNFICDTILANANTPAMLTPKIYINTYPYKLNEKDDTTLISMIVKLIEKSCIVKLIDKPIEQITPNYIKANDVSIYCTYDYSAWLETLTKANILAKQSCPATTMFSPALNRKKDIHIATIKYNNIGAIEAVETAARPFIDLKLLPISLFSINLSKPNHHKID